MAAVIKNVVSVGHFGCSLDLCELQRLVAHDPALRTVTVSYNPTVFSGLLMRSSVLFRSHCQMYKNGKFTVNGGTSKEESVEAAQLYCDILKRIGYDKANVASLRVVNMVACLNVGRILQLQKICGLYPGTVYEAEIFPGVSVRLKYATCVIFASGKVNIFGANCAWQIAETAAELCKRFG